jgi:anhydro-N-acetylmuramic acid kinase
MVYKVIGLMSGSSLDGLDIAYVHLQERATSSAQAVRQWEYELVHTACYSYPEQWKRRLAAAPGLSALEYQRLHVEYGRYLGEMVLRFIEEFGLQYRVQLIASHGHTVFHDPERRMTAQVGDGAALAAVTRINVVSDLRAMDMALGGQGAPIVPIGERLMLPGYEYFLNLGGIANISAHGNDFVAFDVCPANRVLNMLAELGGRSFDEGGRVAAGGRVDEGLLERLDALPYYGMGYPKSLANAFGTETVYPMIREGMDVGKTGEERTVAGMPGTGRTEERRPRAGKILEIADALRTYVEHIAVQVRRALEGLGGAMTGRGGAGRMLVTGGGAHNGFLVERLRVLLAPLGVEVVVPEGDARGLIDFKEALVMALIGVLRWREENNVLGSVTGASRDSIGGAVWIGQEG